MLTGCGSGQTRIVDGLVEGEFGSANSIVPVRTGTSTTLRFYSRVAGGAGPPLVPEEYPVQRVVSSGHVEVRLRALAQEADAMLRATGMTDALSEFHADMGSAGARAIDHVTSSMPSLASRQVRVDLYLVPAHSGRALRVDHVVQGEMLPAAFLHAVGAQDPGVEWSGITTLITHELLHAHYRLAGMQPKLLDEEVAAYMTGTCGGAWLAIESGAKNSEMKLLGMDEAVYRRVFPGLLDGQWNPHLRRLESEFGIREISAQARMVSLALLFHRYADDGVLRSGVRESVSPLLDDCARLPLGPPRYLKGEDGPAIGESP